MNRITKSWPAILGLVLNTSAADVGTPLAITAPSSGLVSQTAAAGASMPVLSTDGQYVAFISRAPNLVTNPTSGSYQVFLRNLTNGNLILVSTTPTGAGGKGHSRLPSFSSNGWWVAFESDASDLVANDTNGVRDIFIRDIDQGVTWMVSGGNGPSRNPIMSPNGYVAFDSRASNLVSSDSNGVQDVFVNAGEPEATALVSVNLAGTGSANGSSELLAITPNGRFVAFWSNGTDITADAVSNLGEVYVRDVQAGVSYCLTKGIAIYSSYRRLKIALTPDGRYAALQELSYSGAAPGGRVFHVDVTGGSISNIYCCGRPGSGLAISDDGSQVIFPGSDGLYLRDMSSTNRLLVRDQVAGFEAPLNIGSFQVSRDFGRLWFTMFVTNRGHQLYVYPASFEDGPFWKLVSTNRAHQPINRGVFSPFSISHSGEIAAFETAADDLATNDLNRAPDVFVTGFGLASSRQPELAEGTGQGFATLHRNSLSANARQLSFVSTDTAIVANDTNRNYDLFVRHFNLNLVQNLDGVARSNSAVNSFISADGRSLIYNRFSGEEFVQTGQPALFRADLLSGQTQPLGVGSHQSLSQDGRWLVMRSGDRILMTDLRTPRLPGQATNQVVDTRYNGSVPGNAPSSNPTISLDGEWVIFDSRATDLVQTGPYPPGVPQLFARNLRQQRTRLLSITSTGAPLPSGATNPVLSASARYVAFQTYSGSNIYRHDLLATGQVANLLICTNCSQPSISGDGQAIAYLSQGQVHVSVAGAGTQTFLGATDVTEIALSIDGRFVAWVTHTPGIAQIYLQDRWNGNRHLVSRSYLLGGKANGPSTRPVFSHDGRTIAFQSFASDLVPGDYNGRRDVFAVQILPVDTDGDGMDDDWEQFYFQSLARDGSGNMDGDHQSDSEEFMAGTDPLDSASSLRVTGITSRTLPGPMQNTEVTWWSAPGKIYRVQYKADLAAPWSDLPGDVMPGGPKASKLHLDQVGPMTKGFYRVRLLD